MSSEHVLPQALIERTSHCHTCEIRNMTPGGKSEMQEGIKLKENEINM